VRHNIDFYSQAPGLVGISWEVSSVPHSGIILLDKLVGRSPDSILVFSGGLSNLCTWKKNSLTFDGSWDEDDLEDLSGIFDAYRPVIFDSYFPFKGLVAERSGFVCLDFGATEMEIEYSELRMEP
jgi:hypothetical protein